ncbi:MAG TPA: aminotransferase class V-fold PLP-dependent enzyme [Cyclobacteriaceae bacterium]
MKSRRLFLQKSAAAIGAFTIMPFAIKATANRVAESLAELNTFSPADAVFEDELWARMAQAYTVSPNILNLNNGGVSPQPKVVQDAVDRYYHLSNEAPSYYMWRILDKGREPVRGKLADLAGVVPETIAIQRNTTEALATVTWGIDLEAGDEIVMTKQDYPNMIHAWKQRELRHGIKINWINLELPIENDETFIKSFVDATTSKTKIWHLTHIINWTGQIMPVSKLCAEARKRGLTTIVDAAHTFAHLDYQITDFNCDYLGTSLHKWLCAPFGTGMLYIKKENIEKTWPIFPIDKPLSRDIHKFEALGTRSFAPEMAIGQAVDFHHAIGRKRKQERLHYLKRYWCEAVSTNPRVKIHVSMNPAYSCAIGTFSIDGMDVADTANKLMNDYQIHTVGIKWENINAVRVTPHVYTTTKDLDRFIDAVLKMASS